MGFKANTLSNSNKHYSESSIDSIQAPQAVDYLTNTFLKDINTTVTSYGDKWITEDSTQIAFLQHLESGNLPYKTILTKEDVNQTGPHCFEYKTTEGYL